jgi:hypothetical protein
MEPHPIPQNVSSFQFRLIGDMTLKQFLYLAVGSALGYVIIILLGSVYPFFAWPLALLSAGAGAAFAFLPIGSRPLDHWLKAFLKAVYSPTKRVWRKNNKNYREDPLFGSRYVTYVSSLQPSTSEQDGKTHILIEQVAAPVNQVSKTQISPNTPTPSAALKPSHLPTPEELKKTVDLAKQAQNLQMQIVQTERTLNQIRSEAQKPSPIPIDYTQEVNTILANLQKLVGETSQIKQQLASVTKLEQPRPLPNIIRVVPSKPKPQQIALTTFPNVISGIVKDNSGAYLEGVIAVIHDKEGLPVRALKTNKLGQFTGSTPLPNGIYTLELEKENHAFDVLQISLTGSVLPPIMITAKGVIN